MALAAKNFSYRGILKKSYQIVKNNRFLLFFGFFAAVISTGGEFEVIFKDYTNIGTSSQNIFRLQTLYQGGTLWSILDNVKNFFSAYPWQAFFFILVALVILIIVIWLAMVSQIALFDATNKLFKNKKTNYLEGFQAGNRHFGRVLSINIVAKVLLYALLAVVAAPLLSWFLLRSNAWGGLLFVLFLFLIFIPFSIIVSFIVKYAVAFVVINGQGAGLAVKSGWGLFKKNWLISLEMAVIILALGLLVGLGILIILGLASIPFFLIAIISLLLGSSTGLTVAVILGVIVWFIIVAIIGSAYVAFQYSAWTLLFLQLVGETAQSKLVRWFGGLAAKKIS